MASFKKYQKLQKYYLNEAVMPPIYKKGEYLGDFQYDTIEDCENSGNPIIDEKAFMFKIYVTSIPYKFNAPIINDNCNDKLTISWGDGVVESFNGIVGTTMDYSGTFPPASHTYNVVGEYIITCWEQVNKILQYSSDDPIVEIMSWGNMPHYGVGSAFLNNKNLVKICGDKFGSFKTITGTQTSLNVVGGFVNTFANTSIKEIPSDLFTYATECISFIYTFSGCENITSIPPDLFKTNKKVLSFSMTFTNCFKIESLPYTLFDSQKDTDGMIRYNMFDRTFQNCSNMKGNVIPLWEWGGNQSATLKTGCYMGCFKLDNYNIIPPGWQNYTAP